MSKVVRVETKDGVTSMTVEISDEQPPPLPEGWKRSGCAMPGNDACIVEDLLVRGFREREAPTMLFALVDSELNRQDLSHAEDIAGIIERCRPHGITVEVDDVFDETDCVRMDHPFRVFRNWRMIGEGCPWDPPCRSSTPSWSWTANRVAACAGKNVSPGRTHDREPR